MIITKRDCSKGRASDRPHPRIIFGTQYKPVGAHEIFYNITRTNVKRSLAGHPILPSTVATWEYPKCESVVRGPSGVKR